MANLTITNIDLAGLLIDVEQNQIQEVPFSGASGNVAKGTILARNASTENCPVFLKGGTASVNGTPVAVLAADLVHTGGVVKVRAILGGKVRKEKLIIAADGDDTNIDEPVKDQLRDYGILPISVTEQNTLDNQ